MLLVKLVYHEGVKTMPDLCVINWITEVLDEIGIHLLGLLWGQDEGTSQKLTFKSREEESYESKSQLLPSAVQAG